LIQKGLKGETFADWARSALHPEAHLVTDGLASFNAAGAQVAAHGAIIVGERNSSDLGPFHWINIFISNAKTRSPVSTITSISPSSATAILPRPSTLILYR